MTRVVYTNRNAKKGDGSVGYGAGELEGRMERLEKREDGI